MVIVDVLVIGAGAAGCLAAIKAAEAGASVVLLDKNDRIGRKLMLTGKGRCNLTNAKRWSQFSTHLHNKPSFFKPAFYEFSNEAVIAMFEKLGVKLVLTRDDRVFPESMRASDIVDALDGRLRQLGVQMMMGCDVNNVSAEGEGFKISYVSSTGTRFSSAHFLSRTVIVATGGLSYPTTGSTGDGYEIAKSFGHTIQRTFPSLTALIPAGYDIRLKDITLINISASLYVGRDMVEFEFGDLQFTDGGIEGPVGFKLSRRAVWALINGDKVSLFIDLKPAVPLDLFKERVAREAAALGVSKYNFESKKADLLRKFMPQQLVEPFADGNSLNLANLAAAIKEWKFSIADYVGYRRAVVTAGGVSLDEVVARTMASRIRPGLFFAGEVLDIDGDTGGYNLQFAFSTGVLAARGAVQYLGSRLS